MPNVEQVEYWDGSGESEQRVGNGPAVVHRADDVSARCGRS
ncbi:MAG TPA: hypothetical protein VE466_09975 [Acidimicrobiales bacterium]|nr:hypothetical protein [Acidimicrobiales bacterium]